MLLLPDWLDRPDQIRWTVGTRSRPVTHAGGTRADVPTVAPALNVMRTGAARAIAGGRPETERGSKESSTGLMVVPGG